MIHYATVRRKKDIISLLCCTDDFASSRAASNSKSLTDEIRRSVSERRAALERYC